MAQDEGAAGPDERGRPEATGSEVPGRPETPDSPEAMEMWGNNGLVGEGRYRLTHRIGRGGMAEVFAAEDVRLGRTVAVKLLRADLAEDPVAKARFTREAQSVAGLNHHAVVAVYDSGEEYMTTTAGRGSVVPYMVMELINGRTIRELLVNAEAPPVEQALILVSGVLEALAYSHQHGIVHRDIKPANVIITETGSVKVMDFGIARALHGAAQTMTQTGMVMGTPQYLSPEQALGKSIDARSDLYAVGCLLYELLSLRPPFVGETPLAVVYQHVQDTPRPPSEVSPDAPPELDGLVMRSLAKDPDDRFQSAEEMRGLVQYALRMLGEHGSHTGGLWNTGPTAATTTPPMGTPTVGTRSTETPTGQYPGPLLLGASGGDGAGPASGGRANRGRLVLVALLAVLAIGTGVLVAASLGGDSSGNNPGDSGNQDGTEQADTRAPDRGSRDPGNVEDEEDDGGSGDTWDPDDTPTESAETDDWTPTWPTEESEPTPTESEPEPEPTESEPEPEPTEPEPEPTPTESETVPEPTLPTESPSETGVPGESN